MLIMQYAPTYFSEERASNMSMHLTEHNPDYIMNHMNHYANKQISLMLHCEMPQRWMNIWSNICILRLKGRMFVDYFISHYIITPTFDLLKTIIIPTIHVSVESNQFIDQLVLSFEDEFIRFLIMPTRDAHVMKIHWDLLRCKLASFA